MDTLCRQYYSLAQFDSWAIFWAKFWAVFNPIELATRGPPGPPGPPGPSWDNRIIDDPLAAFNAAMAKQDARKRERDAYRSVYIPNFTG